MPCPAITVCRIDKPLWIRFHPCLFPSLNHPKSPSQERIFEKKTQKKNTPRYGSVAPTSGKLDPIDVSRVMRKLLKCVAELIGAFSDTHPSSLRLFPSLRCGEFFRSRLQKGNRKPTAPFCKTWKSLNLLWFSTCPGMLRSMQRDWHYNPRPSKCCILTPVGVTFHVFGGWNVWLTPWKTEYMNVVEVTDTRDNAGSTWVLSHWHWEPPSSKRPKRNIKKGILPRGCDT